MLPGTATLSVHRRPPLGLNTAVGFEVSTPPSTSPASRAPPSPLLLLLPPPARCFRWLEPWWCGGGHISCVTVRRSAQNPQQTAESGGAVRCQAASPWAAMHVQKQNHDDLLCRLFYCPCQTLILRTRTALPRPAGSRETKTLCTGGVTSTLAGWVDPSQHHIPCRLIKSTASSSHSIYFLKIHN
jgi:hypothetical protein